MRHSKPKKDIKVLAIAYYVVLLHGRKMRDEMLISDEIGIFKTLKDLKTFKMSA